MFSLFFCSALVLLDFLILEAQGHCRNLRFIIDPIPGYQLENHVIRTIDVSNEDICRLQCYLELNCVSYNFNKMEAANGQHKCDLNNATYEHDNEHSGDLAKNENYVHRGAENVCAKKPCQNNATCQAGFTDSNSLQIVRGRCNGKTECQLQAVSSVFGGDPCRGTYKYLQVKYRCLEYRGLHSSQPGRSCKHIRDSGGSRGDGEYWIDPEGSGNPLKVFCDMTTEGGGWLLVSNAVIDSSFSTPQLSLETTYRGIGNYHNSKTFLTKSAMTDLRSHLSFTQLRFHCSKQGRTFHVTTVANSTGEAVVQYFSGQTDVQPDACGSFVRMDNDNSRLAGVCDQWGSDGERFPGKWGILTADEDRLSNNAAFVRGSYHWLLITTPPGKLRWRCDDSNAEVSSGDFWRVFVR
ncbi:adhesion G protein-coupled receptor L1-like [Orbicella faveolata]|uniref:adhesion G protein-coupled receptor L1-like n=1 Tax=Orbicella faveolata TaxID=48498 RepID=UPI0009E300A1|nr:adhesion G protein-coupled receptor L1-like [Orbicella faveolata]